MYEVILQFPFSNTGKPNGVVSDFQILQTAFFVVVSVLCFLESVVLHYGSSQDECPAVVSVVSPQLLIPGGNGVSGSVWSLEAEVELGDNCDYTIHASLSGPGETTSNSSSLSMSQ